jgi:hypothetical protein
MVQLGYTWREDSLVAGTCSNTSAILTSITRIPFLSLPSSMPSENICAVLVDEYKCSSCHCQVDPASDAQPDALVCAGCRAHLLAALTILVPDTRPERPCIDICPREAQVLRRQRPCDEPQDPPLQAAPSPSYRPAPPVYSKPPPAPEPVFVRTQFVPPRHHAKGADPLTDITRLRVRAQTHHCLYPGASFQGTQKSGRNSYDVNVTIVVCTVSQRLSYDRSQPISISGRRLCLVLSLRLPSHPRPHRRLARAHHLL